MTDIFIRPGAVAPADVLLNDPTQFGVYGHVAVTLDAVTSAGQGALKVVDVPTNIGMVRFNGAAQNNGLQRTTNLPAGVAAFSVACIFRYPSTGGADASVWMLQDGGGASPTHYFNLELSGGVIAVAWTAGGQQTLFTPTAGHTYYVCVTRSSGSTGVAYWGEVGSALTSTNLTGVSTTAFTPTSFTVGTDFFVEPSNAAISNVKVYSAQLSSTEAAREATQIEVDRSANLEFWWKLTSVATKLVDSSGLGRDLTAIGAGSWLDETGPFNVPNALGATTLAATGTLATVTGTVAQTLADTTLSATGAFVVTGTTAQTLADVVGVLSGTVTNVGTVARTLADTGLAASGVVQVVGSVGQTLADTTGAASGAHGVAGSTAQTLADGTLAAAGARGAAGSLGNTLADTTGAAAGTFLVSGAVAQLLADGLLAAAGAHGVAGSTAQTLADTTGAASGAHGVAGSTAQTLAAVSLSASGSFTLTVTGTVVQTLADDTLSAAGIFLAPPTGTVSQTLADATLAASGTTFAPVSGTVAQTLANATLTAAGGGAVNGALARALDGVTLAATGLVPQNIYVTVNATLEGVTLSSSGTAPLVRPQVTTAVGGMLDVQTGVDPR